MMNTNNTNNFRYWQWFMMNNQAEMYDVISAMIKDKISEILPQMIDEKISQCMEKFNFNISTTINGRAANSGDFSAAIRDMIIKSFQ